MSYRGVRQLKELVIRYSDYDGSSKGIREWLRLNIIKFGENNPSLSVRTVLKRCAHPILRGKYVNGNEKTICIKNMEVDVIQDYIMDLRNQIGNKVTEDRYKKPVITKHPSLQGEWNEQLSLQDLKFTIEDVYK